MFNEARTIYNFVLMFCRLETVLFFTISFRLLTNYHKYSTAGDLHNLYLIIGADPSYLFASAVSYSLEYGMVIKRTNPSIIYWL